MHSRPVKSTGFRRAAWRPTTAKRLRLLEAYEQRLAEEASRRASTAQRIERIATKCTSLPNRVSHWKRSASAWLVHWSQRGWVEGVGGHGGSEQEAARTDRAIGMLPAQHPFQGSRQMNRAVPPSVIILELPPFAGGSR